MLKSALRLLPVAAWLGVVWPAAADTITLKSGAKIEGKVIAESAATVTVEYRQSASILDRKTIQRADIVSIEKETPDIAAWQAIATSRPGEHSMPTEQYDAVVRPLKAFIAAFPGSVHLAEAQKNAAAFEEEKKRVDGGEVKVAGRWFTRAEAEKERYQLNGVVALNHMRSQASGGDLIGALNTFTRIEKDLGGSASFPDSVEFAAQVLPTLKATVERAYQNLKTEAIGRQQATPQSRAELEAAAKRDEDAGAAAIAAAESVGLKWPPLNIRSSKSLAKIAEKIAAETPRVGALPVAAMRQSIAAAESAKVALAAGDLSGATTALEGARGWPANELAKRLTAEIAEAKKAAEVAAKAVAAATPPPAPKPAEPAPAKPAPKIMSAVAPVAAAIAEKAKPFYMTTGGVAGIVGVVAVVLIALRVLSAIRRRRSEDED